MSEQTQQSQTGVNVQHRRRVRNYLLDRNLQLRYTLVIVLTSAILTTGLGYFWYSEMRAASRLIEVTKLESLSVDQVDEIGASMESEDHKRLLVLVCFGVLLALVLAGIGIVFTHKIAGPLFKMQQHMRAIRHGRFVPIYELRKGDQLRAFFVQFRLMHEALGEQARKDIAILERVLAAIDTDAAAEAPGVAESQGSGEERASDQSQRPSDLLRGMLESKRDSILKLEE